MFPPPFPPDATKPETPDIIGSVSSLININQVAFTGTGNPGFRIRCYEGSVLVGETTVNPDGSWTLLTNVLSDGPHSLELVQVDPQSNLESDPEGPFDVEIDTTSPVQPVFSLTDSNGAPLTDGSILNTNVISFSGSTGGAEIGGTVKVSIFDTFRGTTPDFTTVIDNQGNWSLTIPALPDCHFIITVITIDQANNQSLASAPVQIIIDTTGPTVSLEPVDTDGDSFIESIALTASDGLHGSGVKEIQYSIDGGPFTVVSGSIAVIGDLPGSGFTISFFAEDNAGNAGAVITETYQPDACHNSELNETIVIDGCDSQAPNSMIAQGCAISDLISECAQNTIISGKKRKDKENNDNSNDGGDDESDDGSGDFNHGQFTSCVSKLANQLKKDGIISKTSKGAIQKCAAKADIP